MDASLELIAGAGLTGREMENSVEAAFQLLQQDLDEETIIARLAAMGCPMARAEKLVCFLPLACGRIVLADTGIAFSSAFRCMGDDRSISEPRPLAADADWVAVDRWLATNKNSHADAVRVVGMRSAEFDAVNKALLGGSKPSDLVGSDAIFGMTYQTPQAHRNTRPWWSFWRK